jgi:hypothetical protein
MMHWRKMAMSAALLVLTSAAYDLLVIDFWEPAACTESAGQSRSGSDDECFCCCAHIVLAKPASVEPVQIVDVAEPPSSAVATVADPPAVYHPPRLASL